VRVLLTTRGSSGHVGPPAEFGHAARRAGHEVLVAAQPQHAANVERTGLPFAPLGDPPPEAWMPLLGEFAALDFDTAHERMIGEFFAGIDVQASLAPLAALVDDFQPDVILRESFEFASTLVADARDVPLVRVGLGLASLEEQTIGLAARALEPERARLGLPADPSGAGMRATPYLTTVPAPLDDGAAGPVHRFGHPRPAAQTPPLPADWWPAGDDHPLVYLSFGSVTAGSHLPFYPSLYRAAIDALADVEARVLLTVGEDRDHAELGPLPPNLHVERWFDQDGVLPHAWAAVIHGGYGSTLGALSHGVPLVVLPLFSGDQFVNAAAVARSGAGVALGADGARRGALDLPPADVLAGLCSAVERVLADPAPRRRAAQIADAMAALPPVDAAVELLADVTR
jgi:UDP:flavonoid glycosyltransferase YjiC (YdhE family)